MSSRCVKCGARNLPSRPLPHPRGGVAGWLPALEHRCRYVPQTPHSTGEAIERTCYRGGFQWYEPCESTAMLGNAVPVKTEADQGG